MTEGRRARARRWQNAAVRVLLVEDDARMRAIVRRGLVESAHAVETADSAHGALLAAAAGRFDAAVLDVMLPDGSGLDVVRTLRGRGDATPILLLTARDTADDITAGLDAGADDYLVKPFAFKVLLARLRALGRRSPVVDTPIRRVADLAMDDAAHLVTRSGTPIALTRTEYGLLDRLMRRAVRNVGAALPFLDSAAPRLCSMPLLRRAQLLLQLLRFGQMRLQRRQRVRREALHVRIGATGAVRERVDRFLMRVDHLADVRAIEFRAGQLVEAIACGALLGGHGWHRHLLRSRQ